MKTSLFRRHINAHWIGFDPDEMEAAHIANGLFLEITGEQYTAEDTNRLAVIADKRGPVKGHENTTLLDELSPLQGVSEGDLALLRAHIRQHVGADGALFDQQIGVGCAYSAASARLVVNDRHNDGWSGNFIGKLLRIDFGWGESPILSKLGDALIDETDPLSAMLMPFLASEKTSFDQNYNDLTDDHFESLVRQHEEMHSLRGALDTFAAYYPTYLSKQRFARLLVILTSGTLLRYIATLAQKITLNERIPFLVDASQKSGTRTRFASQLSYIRCVVVLTEFYERLVQQYIFERAVEVGGSEQVTIHAVRNAIKDVTDQLEEELLKDEKKRYVLDEQIGDWRELLRDTAHHIVEMLFDKQGIFVSAFFRSVGIRAGMVVPRGPYPRKHFAFQPDTLTALTMACIAPDAVPMTMREFTDILWERFGFLVGGGAEDIEILHRAAIRDVNEDDLYSNYQAFTQLMVSLGLAQQRSDGLVLVHPVKR